VGIFTIQISKMYGFNVVTTCSPRNFDIVKAHGAKHVFDYSNKDVVKQIAEAVPDLAYTFDCIGNPTSSTLSAQAMGDKKGVICTVRPGKQHTENVPKKVQVTDVLIFTAFLKPHVYKVVLHWPVGTPRKLLMLELH
jgi:NADPH:quinone reductase-like Zn-dependent oxidoreductase